MCVVCCIPGEYSQDEVEDEDGAKEDDQEKVEPREAEAQGGLIL